MSSKFVSFVIFFFKKFSDDTYMEPKGKQKETKGKDIVDRISKKLAEFGMSKAELTEIIDRAPNTLQNWASRNTIPPADAALEIADVLKCSVRWLITGKKDKQEEYSPEERNLITRYRNLDRQGRFEINALLEAKTIPVAMEKKQTAG